MDPALQNNQYNNLQEHWKNIGPALYNAAEASELKSELLLPPQRTVVAPPTRTIEWNDPILKSTLLMRSMGSGLFGSVWKV